MKISNSLNAKLTLLVALISVAVFACIMLYNAISTRHMAEEQIQEAAATEADLIYMSIEKPMIIGDNASTVKEFKAIREKFPLVTAHVAAFNGNVTYSTDDNAVRSDLGKVVTDGGLQALVQRSLKQPIKESIFTTMNGKAYAARVISIPNAPRCHHCHGSSEPILGQMTLLSDVSANWLAMQSQAFTSAGVGAAGLLSLIAAMIVAIRIMILKKFKTIADAAGKVTAGDFKVNFDVAGSDELARLAGDLGSMVGQLKNKLGFSEGVLNGIPTPCAIVNADHRMGWINKQMCDLLEKPKAPDAYKGQRSGEFFWGDPNRETLSDKAIKQRQGFTAHREWPTPSGKIIHANVSTTPFFDMDGTLLGSITFWIDVTEMVEQQKKIETQHNAIAEAASRADQISQRLAAASEQLSAQIDEATSGTHLQRERIQETATAVEEMNASILEVAKNAGDAAVNADKARDRARHGQTVTDESIRAIMAVRDQTANMRQSLHELGEQAQNIGRVIDIITDIADQTNLLALNAAIEAARAGEHGRGFAVVADEVRKLAEKTMSATKEVNQAISGIQDGARRNIDLMEAAGRDVESGAEMVKRAGQSLQEIVDVSVSTADMVRSIATAAEEQSAASEQITKSIDEVNRIAGDTAHNMSESAQATNEVAQMASALKEVMDSIKD